MHTNILQKSNDTFSQIISSLWKDATVRSVSIQRMMSLQDWMKPLWTQRFTVPLNMLKSLHSSGRTSHNVKSFYWSLSILPLHWIVYALSSKAELSTSTLYSIKLHKQYLIEIWWQWMRKKQQLILNKWTTEEIGIKLCCTLYFENYSTGDDEDVNDAVKTQYVHF